MVPGPNVWTNPAVPSQFLAPYSDGYSALNMRCSGGTAIGNGSNGREVQYWSIQYDGTNLLVYDSTPTLQYTLNVGAGVLTCALAFDTNMAPTICYMMANGGYLYFFNSQTSSYQTLYFSTITSCRVAVDKTTQFFNGQSDVIFAYVRALGLYYRIQRDRYAIEYTAPLNGVVIDLTNPIVAVGPTTNNRLQFQLR